MKKTKTQMPAKGHDMTSKGNSNIIGDALKSAGDFKKPAPTFEKVKSKGDTIN